MIHLLLRFAQAGDSISQSSQSLSQNHSRQKVKACSTDPDVPGGDPLWEGEPLGKVGGHPNLPRGQVGVRGDDGPGSKVDTLAHHVLAEQPFLLLQNLPDALQPIRTVG